MHIRYVYFRQIPLNIQYILIYLTTAWSWQIGITFTSIKHLDLKIGCTTETKSWDSWKRHLLSPQDPTGQGKLPVQIKHSIKSPELRIVIPVKNSHWNELSFNMVEIEIKYHSYQVIKNRKQIMVKIIKSSLEIHMLN